MKGPIATSVILHIVLLMLGVLSLSSREKLEAGGESLPIEMVSIEELTQIQQGDQKAPKAEKAAPTPTEKPADDPNAKNVGDNVSDVETPPKPAEKPKPVETANAPAPQPKPVKKPELAKPEQEKTDAVAEAIAKEEAAAAKAAEAAKKAEAAQKAEAAKAAEAKAAEAAKAEAKAEEQAKIEAEALLKAEADVKAAEEEKKAADKAAKEKAAAEKAEKAAEEKAAKEAAAKAEKEAEEKAAAEAEAKAAEEAKAAKAAEAKAAKAAKAAEAKKAAAAQAAEEKKLADDIKKALLNTEKGTTGGKKKSTDQAALGGKKTTGGAKLSLSEMDALRSAIQGCFSSTPGINDVGSSVVKVKFNLTQAGDVDGSAKITSKGGGSGAEVAAAEALRRAVMKCAPYNLPAEKYDTWSEVEVSFDLSKLSQ